MMDLLQKLDMMVDTTVPADVATNTAKGHIDVIGGECPKGTVYDKAKKVCVPTKNESSVAAAVAGSGQTRVWGSDFNLIDALDTKEPVEIEMADKAKENIEGRLALKFDSLLGFYNPKKYEPVDDTQMED
jgi:hypothetical protein